MTINSPRNGDIPLWQIAAVLGAMLLAAFGVFLMFSSSSVTRIVVGAIVTIVGIWLATVTSEVQG